MKKGAIRKAFYDLLPGPIRIQGRSFFKNVLEDARDIITRRADPRIPPRCLDVSGNGPFQYLGQQNLELCQDAGLQPDDIVLDLGCGIGRTTLAMTEYLTEGSYVGLDIIDFAIQWRKQHIAPGHPNFSFIHADIFNGTYNPRGRIAPHQYKLPFPVNTFSFGLATSLFTHTLPPTTENYLREFGKVIQPNGKLLSTWFLLTGSNNLAEGLQPPLFSFAHRFENYALNDINQPEQAIAYELGYIEKILATAGLQIERVGRGNWSGLAPDSKYGQDYIVARKGA